MTGGSEIFVERGKERQMLAKHCPGSGPVLHCQRGSANPQRTGRSHAVRNPHYNAGFGAKPLFCFQPCGRRRSSLALAWIWLSVVPLGLAQLLPVPPSVRLSGREQPCPCAKLHKGLSVVAGHAPGAGGDSLSATGGSEWALFPLSSTLGQGAALPPKHSCLLWGAATGGRGQRLNHERG